MGVRNDTAQFIQRVVEIVHPPPLTSVYTQTHRLTGNEKPEAKFSTLFLGGGGGGVLAVIADAD